MRSSVNLRAYGQRDPLVEYKREGLRLFKDMQQSINLEILKAIPNIGQGMLILNQAPVVEIHENAQVIGAPAAGATPTPSSSSQSINHSNEEKIGRNDPCPCGSGKKYKNCGLKNTEEHQRNMANKI